MTSSIRFSANQLATQLGVDPPTKEQAAIIEAPLEGVYRVVAGAGSGKTETMALRVVWLIANGFVQPHQVLGLTFTRKAAGELLERLSKRIRSLPRAEDDQADIFHMPQVSTYNSFASRLFQDYAVYLGVDSDGDVAGQAAAWSLARKVVVSSSLPELDNLDITVDRLATLTWLFSSALSENDVDEDALLAHAQDFARLEQLPLGSKFLYESDMAQLLGSQALIPTLVELVRRFREEKTTRGMVEYSDQVRLALEVTTSAPDLVGQLRDRYRVVLLDEYQDTSVLQTRLLSTLFRDHPVMAVGDPHQAIYGWRGASAGNLADFEASFATVQPAVSFRLSTSWRNPIGVLGAANQIAAPLRSATPYPVDILRPADSALRGEVECVFPEALEEEAEAVANWFATQITPDSTPSAALLVRQRSHQHLFARALEKRGIPVHILGIGGLLADPVVAEIVCGLAVVHRPHANGEVVRLLTSGLFRLGVSDLDRLSRVAKWLVTRDSSGQALSDPLQQAMREQALGVPAASLSDAVDYLSRVADDHHSWRGFSDEAKTQLREAATLIAQARTRSHEPLAEQVSWWERATLLDIEREANPQRRGSTDAREAFLEAMNHYQGFAEDTQAAGFLDWLEQAEWRDSLTPRTEAAEPGCVQILTIHGAKGLEWDLVAVVRMVDDELPGKSPEGTSGWLSPGVLPYPFRGDAEYLPRFDWAKAETRKDLVAGFKQFKKDIQSHQLAEERRLAYVAMTRAKKALLLSGSWWATQKNHRSPSLFLRELAEAGIIENLPDTPARDVAPELAPETFRWPGDPLGSRREAIEQSASLVSAALNRGPMPDDADRELIDRVLREERERTVSLPASWPVRIPASQFDRWVWEPKQMLTARLQPRPATVGVAQQQGTLFHEWVEEFFHSAGHGRIVADVDIDSDALPTADADLERWQEAFLASRYAKLRPIAIEREIHYPLSEHLIICKIDAVFDDGGRVVIVDWKTGRKPSTDEEISRKALQLALYRLAWAEWAGIDVDLVDAALWFADSDTTIQPDTLPDRAQLEKMLADAKAASS